MIPGCRFSLAGSRHPTAMEDLKDRVALVTGGGQGIGKGIVRHLLACGMRVVVAEVDEEAGRETEAEYRALGPVRFVRTDVGEEASVEAAGAAAVGAFGGLDALVNNAGLADPENPRVEELPLERWERVLRTNLTGCFLCARAAAPHLRARRGAIVNIASTRAFMSEPSTEAYAASKGGVVALTHALAISLGPDVRVNCISPGWIDVRAWQKSGARDTSPLRPEDHAQHPAGRVGRPEDVAALAAYLISDAAAFVTGQNVTIDGGMTRKMIYAE